MLFFLLFNVHASAIWLWPSRRMKINFTLNRTKNFNNICVAALNRQTERQSVCLTDRWIEGHRLPDRERWQDGGSSCSYYST